MDVIETGANNTVEAPPPRLVPQEVNVTIQRLILDEHNYYRSLTALGYTPGYPAATDIESLIWDPALASVAQSYADQCVWNHNANRKTQFYATSGQTMWYDSNDIGVGENLYAFAPGSDDPSSIVWGIGSWYNEYPNWSYTQSYPGTCQSGKICGHFTQLVWGNTRYVGCGVTLCPNGLNGWTNRASTIVVCDYWPPGNYGGRPIYNSASNADEVASECNGRHGDNAVSGLCEGCFSSYNTQCTWNEYSTCSPDDCAGDTCTHCHDYCLNNNVSICSGTCLSQMSNQDQCTDNLGRNLGIPSTTTTTQPPQTQTRPPQTQPPLPTSSKSSYYDPNAKCCARNIKNNIDVSSCGMLAPHRCSVTRRCTLC